MVMAGSAMEMQPFVELIDLIYAAAMETGAWPVALTGIARHFGCDSAAMRITDAVDLHNVFGAFSGTEEDVRERFSEYFAASLAHLSTLKAVSNRGFSRDVFVIGDNEAVRLEFADGLKKKRIGDVYLSGILFKLNGRIVHIALSCRHEHGDIRVFREQIARLMPHLRRAFEIVQRLSELQYLNDSFEETMNHFSSAVILLDERGMPVFLNRRAREMVGGMQGISIVGGQITGESAQNTQRLRQLVDAVVAQGKCGGGKVGAMAVQHRDGESIDLSIVAVPLHPQLQALSDYAGIYAALLIGSRDFASGLNPEVLQLLFNLTAAEARLAMGLASDMSLEDYCRRQGIRISTARGYLKQIFQKTGTNRQAALVCLLRSIPFYL